jgi:hypothetical protein
LRPAFSGLATEGQRCCAGWLHVFMPPLYPRVLNRIAILHRILYVRSRSTPERTMPDFVFLALGLAGFALMALYASAAERL